MSKTSHNIYLKALRAFHNNDIDQFNYFRKSTELSRAQKTLLKARHFYRLKKWEEALECVRSVSSNSDDYYLGERYTIEGYICSQLGRYQEWVPSYQKALDHFSRCNDRKGIFLTSAGLFYHCLICGKYKEALIYLQTAEQNTHSLKEKLRTLGYRAEYYSKIGKFEEAMKIVNKILADEKKCPTPERGYYYIIAAEIAFKAKKLKEFYQYIDSPKGKKFHYDQGEIIFFKILRNYYEYDKWSRKAPEAIKHSKIFHLKWKIIDRLREGRKQEVIELWSQLIEEDPYNYEKDFLICKNTEEASIFIQCALKMSIENEILRKTLKLDPPAKGKTKQLLECFYDFPYPQSKEDLIEDIWDIDYDPAYDNRFYKLIERFNKCHHPLVIKKSRGGYVLEQLIPLMKD